jgi:hypothetical protein
LAKKYWYPINTITDNTTARIVLLSIKPSKFVTLFSFYRVISAGVPGVAAENPPDAHKRPLARAVTLYGGDRVFGTGGIESTTGAREWGDEYLVTAHQYYQESP